MPDINPSDAVGVLHRLNHVVVNPSNARTIRRRMRYHNRLHKLYMAIMNAHTGDLESWHRTEKKLDRVNRKVIQNAYCLVGNLEGSGFHRG